MPCHWKSWSVGTPWGDVTSSRWGNDTIFRSGVRGNLQGPSTGKRSRPEGGPAPSGGTSPPILCWDTSMAQQHEQRAKTTSEHNHITVTNRQLAEAIRAGLEDTRGALDRGENERALRC